MPTPDIRDGRPYEYASATRTAHLRHVHHSVEVPAEPDDPSDPWALLPSEVVCPGCNLAHHKHLPTCPTCRLEIRGR